MIDSDEAIEVVDGLPVLGTDTQPASLAGTGDGRTAMAHARPRPAALSAVPKRQVLALVASSFVCGAATILLSSRGRPVKVTPRRLKPSLPDIIGSDRYLIDVHTLRR